MKSMLFLYAVSLFVIFVAIQANADDGGIVVGDTGCWRPTYGRGVGKVISVCQDGEEKNGALCYPKCKDGYYGVGPVCWQSCPKNFIVSGVDCSLKSYGRGAGNPLSCADGLEEDAALCYKPCTGNGYHGEGPVCWRSCPDGLVKCGALCLESTKSCIKDVLSIAEEVAITAAKIAEDPKDALQALKDAIAKIGSELKYPLCSDMSS